MKPHIIFWLVAAAATFLDLLTKHLAFDWLGGEKGGTFHTFISPILDFRCARNTGGVFGILPETGFVFVPLSFVALGFVYWFFITTFKKTWKTLPPLALISAGTLGNLYDRLMFRGVRDFIDFHVGSFTWPTFNLADTWICTGCGILILLIMTEPALQEEKHQKGKQEQAATESEKDS
ncbi:MAG: signal peptidase II [Planctomycetota bacterium]|nr:signal peptidase II [Planctomycetota bacterium]